MADTVYFARDLATGHIKIGYTGQHINRRIQLLRHKHPQVVLLATVAGDRRLEDALHAALMGSHVTGEWFRPDDAVLAIVGRAALGLFDPAEFPPCLSPLRSATANRVWAARRATPEDAA